MTRLRERGRTDDRQMAWVHAFCFVFCHDLFWFMTQVLPTWQTAHQVITVLIIIPVLLWSGAINETDCTDCTPGYYCAGFGNVEPTGLCEANFFCAGKASTGRPYDPGNLVSANGTITWVCAQFTLRAVCIFLDSTLCLRFGLGSWTLKMPIIFSETVACFSNSQKFCLSNLPFPVHSALK